MRAGNSNIVTRLIVLIGFILSADAAKSQAGLCPFNLDFENGDFTNWECRTGRVKDSLGFNVVSLPNFGEVPGQHTIFSTATAGTDIFGGFPQLCPNGSGYSVMLGDNAGGANAASISYTYTIPSNLTVFSVLFHYAIVMQDPNHQPQQQPRFRARIVDVSTDQPIPCVDFDFTASAFLPGFHQSTWQGNVYYKDWTPITINLSAYIGRTIKLEFITSDCTFSAHFGYAYIDVNSNCNGAISGSTICRGISGVNLTAPYGFASYQWFADNTFNNPIGNSQNLSLNPAPPVGSSVPVIVTPYPGFGCRDTLYAIMGIADKPPSFAGPDVGICQSQQAQLGGSSTLGYKYEWTPANQVSNSHISNPFAWGILPVTNFIVKTTDLITGCYSYDTTLLNTALVDTTLLPSSTPTVCIGGPLPSLNLNPALVSIQWYNDAGPIPGETGPRYQTTVPGDYWAQVSQNGCTDSTRVVGVTVNPYPIASFTADLDSGCVTRNSFHFTNTSTIPNSSTLNHSWIFSDGSGLQTPDAIKTFSTPGIKTIRLETTSVAGCKDTAWHSVQVFPNGSPNFSFDSICTQRPVLFKNLTNENGSVGVDYSWYFDNGSPAVLIKNPPVVNYSTAGFVNVSLQVTTTGCESDPVIITKKLQVNPALTPQRYYDITVPLGSAMYIHARELPGGNFSWRPLVSLSSFNTRYAEFYAVSGDDVRYYIDVTDKHTCAATDTLQIQILKKPGFYLPTAFTPNGDGLNDVAKPYLVGMKGLKSFSIFSRWGNRIFYSTTYGEGWNGKYGGNDQNPGVYVWTLEFYDSNNTLVTEKGTLTLIK